MNLTNQCNLSCQYCYEFGEDKVATPEGKPKFMDWETAKASVEYLLAQSPGRQSRPHHFLRRRDADELPAAEAGGRVRERARRTEQGGKIDFSLTTNATLLTPAIIEFLAENRIGVTVSMDGPKEMHDKLRVFCQRPGQLRHHRAASSERCSRSISTRPIAARVTLTQRRWTCCKIYKHLKARAGLSRSRLCARDHVARIVFTRSANRGMDGVLAQFCDLADEYLEYALRGEHARLLKRQRHDCGTASGSQQVASLRRRTGPAGRGSFGRYRAVPPLRGLRRAHSRATSPPASIKMKQKDFLDRGHIDTQVRLPGLLGAAVVRGRLPPRSLRPLRRYRTPQPALLRLDPRLD